MKLNKTYILLAASALILASCHPNIDVKPVGTTSGSANFSHYISIGNSLTAGYADGGLYLDGQQNSYPSIIAAQMKALGAGTFYQPLFDASVANGSGYLQLSGFDTLGNPILMPVTTSLAFLDSATVPLYPSKVPVYTKYTGNIDNFGVPGIKLSNITFAWYGNYNPYYERMLPGSIGTHTTPYLSFVTSHTFTFFSNWLGNNDALGYATTGGAGDVLTGQTDFNTYYQMLLDSMTAQGAKGVCATIPDVTVIPYFTTITPALLLANIQKSAPTVPAIYIKAKKTAVYGDTTYEVRPATAKDHIILTFPTALFKTTVSSPIGSVPYGVTPYSPIDNQYVLDSAETIITQTYVTAYNNSIKNLAAAKGLAVADMYTFLNNVHANGLVADGISLNTSFISGGLFSLDGVHLTPRGYAVVANEFIKAINAQYGSTIPLANVAAFRGVKFP